MSDIVIGEYVEEAKPNPYVAHVAALIEAGEGKSVTITVPFDGIKKAQFKFARAANDAGKTARLRNTVEDGKGNVALVFTLVEKHKPRRRKGAKAEVKAVE